MKMKLTLRALPVVLTTLTAAASICHTTLAHADEVPSNTVRRECRPQEYTNGLLWLYPAAHLVPGPGACIRSAAKHQDDWQGAGDAGLGSLQRSDHRHRQVAGAVRTDRIQILQ